MMDYFELEEQKQCDKLEEKKFQELYEKQAKISKIVLLSCFLPIGIIFFILGIVLALVLEDELKIEGFIFGGLGVLFFFIGILFFFLLP